MYFESSPYASLWNKYRPVILQLMIAAGEPQEYKLSAHEFKAVGRKEKAYSFVLEVSQGKAINNIKGSTVARDLLGILQQSQKATQLMREGIYELSLDKHFVFRVTKRVEVVAEAPVAE
jgi:hypothetical protein